MKSFLTASILLFSLSSLAKNQVICPVLKGEYQCVVSDGSEIRLIISESPGLNPGDIRYGITSVSQPNNLTNSIYWADGVLSWPHSLTTCISDAPNHDSILTSKHEP